MASGKRTDLFLDLQATVNIRVVASKRWKLVLDSGIHWNVTYTMICHALELKEALNMYTAQLCVLKDKLNKETCEKDYITPEE
jgi:hypothetical protein